MLVSDELEKRDRGDSLKDQVNTAIGGGTIHSHQSPKALSIKSDDSEDADSAISETSPVHKVSKRISQQRIR